MTRDPKVAEAKDVLMGHFLNKKGDPIRTPYYLRQLEVLYEGRFFEWVIVAALNELEKERYLTVFDRRSIPELDRLKTISRIKFYANADAVETVHERKMMRKHVISTASLIKKYSSADVAKMLGRQLESLVRNQLLISQFEIVGEHTNKYDGKKWTKTAHNLDFIAKKRGKNLVIGVEVKNTLSLMEPDEIDTKIDICRHLGIVPVFAVRWNKPYIHCVQKQGGFTWIFKTQIFPFGQEKLVKQLYSRLSVEPQLKFPITNRNSLPERSIKPFNDWVSRVEDRPPEIDTNVRCQRSPGARPRDYRQNTYPDQEPEGDGLTARGLGDYRQNTYPDDIP